MDEEELKKRFTDCVYFLASPLTCKKGIECEYRHSELARLNPRDCWYWLGGGCLNPDCAFRHPPLEGFKEAYSESADPANKKNTPCYFYANGFCNKGDKCSFIHGPANASLVNNAVPPEKKLSAGSNTGSTPIESHPEPSETTQIEHAHTESKPTQDSQQLASASTEKSESPDISGTQIQENEFVQSESEVFTDHSSYEQANGYLEREEWLESSPGFDVLVEGGSERLGYQKMADYFPVHDEEVRELDVHYVEYDCADPIEYNPAYPEMGNPERYGVYDRLDNKQSNDDVGKVIRQSRESIFYRLSFQKPDLRDRLKKRKVVGDSFRGCFYKPNFEHRIRRNPRRHNNRGGSRKAVHMNNRYRQPPWSRKSTLQQKRTSREESATFTGPKTLDQIKEEKQKALQNEDLGLFDGFKGPRPLSEILKNKRKLGSAVDRDGNKN